MTREGYNVEHLISILKDFKQRHPNLQIILEPGYSIYYVGKMYISSDYKYSTAHANIMDFNLSADYTLNFVQQTN